MTPDQDRILARRTFVKHYEQTFTTESGAIVLAEMARSLGRRVSFMPGDPMQTAFREGERSVYLMILDLLEEASRPMPSVDEAPSVESTFEEGESN